jgi:hypothetical protein
MSSFIQDCVDGKADAKDIEKYIRRWCETDSGIEMLEYLGMTYYEYKAYIADPKILDEIIQFRYMAEIIKG